jgi:hypothetical protein
LTAEGIRTAFYFGIACGRELRLVLQGSQPRSEALSRYHDFCAEHEWKFRSMLLAQRTVPRVPPRALAVALRAMGTQAFVNWSFGHYLRIAPPEFATRGDALPPPGPGQAEAPLERAAA